MQSYRRFWLLAYALTLGLAAYAGTANTQSAGELIDDKALTAQARTELLREADLKSSRDDSSDSKGNVQLSDFVGSPSEAGHAVQIAQNTPGVKPAHNDMRPR